MKILETNTQTKSREKSIFDAPRLEIEKQKEIGELVQVAAQEVRDGESEEPKKANKRRQKVSKALKNELLK